jgi:hypothetical protein
MNDIKVSSSNGESEFLVKTMMLIASAIFILNVTLMIFLDVEHPIVTNAQEISTGYVYHINEDMDYGDGYIVATRPTGKYYLIGEKPRRYYRITEYTYRDDGQVRTYVLKEEKTGEQRTMRRLYDDERVMRTRKELLEFNEQRREQNE